MQILFKPRPELTVRSILIFLGVFTAICIHTVSFAKPSADYLPADAALDTSIPSPESQLGWEPGDWRIQHPSLVQYLYTLAEKSGRVSIKVTGRTYEQKPLLQVIITSEENQSKIESLRQAHLKGASSGNKDAPLVVWLGYSVHGDEASGTNAAPIVAWYLAASQSDYIKDLLKDTIIIIDPSLNPDGLDRFATWANSNASMNPVGETEGRIHHQTWPGGRTNHYLFDLNRDWLPLVHPESRARITEFHRWLPHVLTDHHETGDDGFFFQPGAPTRQHPLTTAENLEMTRKLVPYHTDSFDSAGEMYFTEDTYDDFYYGKGSTYPDINGSIGILYEQPRVNGAIMNRKSGQLEFSEAIHNHVRMSLSTLKGAWELRDEFKQYQADFFRQMQQRANKAGFQGWIIGDANDRARAAKLMDVFKRHQVEYRELADEVTVDGKTFKPGHAWVIPVKQRQFGLAQAMLETRTRFEDNTFYDVSAWNLAMANNLPYAKLSKLPATKEASRATGIMPADQAVAWIVPWQQLNAPALLQQLLGAKARVRIATKPFAMRGDAGSINFTEGSLVLLTGIQDKDKSENILKILQSAASDGINVHSFNTQLATSGPGLGTSHYKVLPALRPLLIVGEGTRSYDAGEAWFQLDQNLGVATVMTRLSRLNSIDLDNYTHLIMVDGRYSAISKKEKQNIALWVNNGGVLVTSQSAASWAENLCFNPNDCDSDKAAKAPVDEATKAIPYGDFDDQRAKRIIGGAIVRAIVDPTHPIAYGYDDEMPLFRKGSTLLKTSSNAFSTPVSYAQDPLISGYISEQRLNEMKGQAAVIAERQGQGVVIRFANNPIFRGFWSGTERLWVNALYFGPLIRSTELPQ